MNKKNTNDSREDAKTDTKSVENGSRQRRNLTTSVTFVTLQLGLVLSYFREIDRF